MPGLARRAGTAVGLAHQPARREPLLAGGSAHLQELVEVEEAVRVQVRARKELAELVTLVNQLVLKFRGKILAPTTALFSPLATATHVPRTQCTLRTPLCTSSCRRTHLLSALSQVVECDHCGDGCDNCASDVRAVALDATSVAAAAVRAVGRLAGLLSLRRLEKARHQVITPDESSLMN